MDKGLTKSILMNTNVKTAKSVLFNVNNDDLNKICNELGTQNIVVKPCSCGSSAGVTIVRTKEELENAIQFARKYGENLLIEEYIEGREFSVGILEGECLPPIEIIPKQGFYDYKNKYQAGLTEEICPANLSEEETKEIGEAALEVHTALKLEDYSRIDFMYDGKKFHCLEANTLPGMTPTSLLPQEALAVGITYEQLCNKIVEMGMK